MQGAIVEGFRLSPQQRRLWFLQGIDPEASYAAHCVVRIEGRLNAGRLKRAVGAVVSWNEILRTEFHRAPEMSIPVQVVNDGGEIHLDERDLTGFEIRQRDIAVGTLLDELRRRPFDFEAGPLIRATLVATSSDEHLLLLSLPALCADNAALKELVAEIILAYDGSSDNEAQIKPAQYADLAEWQNELLELDETAAGREYWKKLDLSSIGHPKLPFEHEATGAKKHSPRFVERSLDAATVSCIDTLSRVGGSSTFAFLLSVWQTLIWRLTGHRESVVGAGYDCRSYEELETSLGLFAKYVPFAVALEAGWRFDELTRRVKETADEIAKWQLYFSWEQLLKAPDHKSTAPFFSYGFDFCDLPPKQRADSVSFTIEELDTRADQFKLRLSCMRRGDSLVIRFYYEPSFFDVDDIERLSGQFHELVKASSENPETRLNELNMLEAAEGQRLRSALNGAGRSHLQSDCIHKLIERQADRTPEDVAVVFEAERLSYRDLNARANKLARYLQRLGVGPETLVAICLERSVEMIVGLLGILKAGGAYVPIDPATPEQRISRILEQTKARVVIAHERLRQRLPASEQEIVRLDADWDLLERESDAALISGVTAANLAYVIFTSGSTGEPKGVAVEHRQLVNYVNAIVERLELQPGESFATVSTLAADLGNTAIFPALVTGGQLHVVSEERASDAAAMAEYVDRQNLDCLKIVPSHLAALMAGAAESGQAEKLIPRLRLVLGGEASRSEWIEEMKLHSGSCMIFNHYGPTESTVGVLAYNSNNWTRDRRCDTLPLGRPIANVKVRILDVNGRIAPFWVPGELYIGGSGLARGYLNRPDLTAERFVPDPFGDEPGARLYRTGDLARCLPDGNVEYLGRVDDQVKLRGFRIELGEIESVLREHPAVHDAKLLIRKDQSSGDCITAYIVPDLHCAPTVRRLLRFEREGLLTNHSRYELPNGMVAVDLNKNETEFMYREIFQERTYLKHGISLDDGDCVFDVGANIGLFTLFISRTFRNARIYAFEPIPEVFKVLRLNTSLYGLNAKLFECGLADQIRSETFTYYPHISMMSTRYADEAQERDVLRSYVFNEQQPNARGEMLDEVLAMRLEGKDVTCHLQTLSSILRDERLDRIDLLKIDVQKSEADVLAGIEHEDWPKIRQIVLEVHDIDDRLDKITSLLRERGFEVVAEQEQALANACLYNVYARRRHYERGSSHETNGRVVEAGGEFHSPDGLITDVRRFLSYRLPDYMSPSAFVFLEAMPLTANGKIDRDALPTLDRQRAPSAGSFAAPRDEVEGALAAILERVLGRMRIGIHDSFFDIGGHSLNAIQVVSLVQKECQTSIGLRDLFNSPTIAGLARIIREARSSNFSPIEPLNERPYYDLSHAQKRLWFSSQVEEASKSFNIASAHLFEGILSIEPLQRAFDMLVSRHEILRTRFVTLDGEPKQVIDRERRVEINLIVLTENDDKLDLARDLAKKEASTAFDLEKGPLFRVTLVRLEEEKHVLLLTMHHIVSDGVSIVVLVNEALKLYRAFKDLKANPLSELRIQYKDYAAWHNEQLKGEAMAEHRDYWRRTLSGKLTALELPTDFARPPVQTFNGTIHKFAIEKELTSRVKELARDHGVTLFMSLTAALTALLHRYSGQEDIIIGSPISGRVHTDLENQVGFYLNMLVLRTAIRGEDSFADLLAGVRRCALEAYEHQAYPFDCILKDLNLRRDPGRSPLVDVGLTLQSQYLSQVHIDEDFRISTFPQEIESATHDLWFYFNETNEQLLAHINYNTDLFTHDSVSAIASRFVRLVGQVVDNPGLRVMDIDLLSESGRPAEASDLVIELNFQEDRNAG